MKLVPGVGRSSGRRGGAPSLEWPTIVLIAGCYAAWFMTGQFVWPSHPFLALAGTTFAIALQSSLMHEAAHGHPTRKVWLNELLVGLPIGLVWPYRRFKSLHLQHHADERLTDPFDDPESYYRALWQHRQLPAFIRFLLAVNNTMLGRFAIGPVLANIGFVSAEVKLLARGDQAVRRAWLHHVAGLVVVVLIVCYGFGMPFWLYVLVPVWLGQSLIAIRTFAEHQWSERPEGRTIIVERSPLAFLFLNNNLHFVHHKEPRVAWYKLPTLFRERRDEWVRQNNGYAYPNYSALFLRYALKPKEPVVHPFLRREPEQGRAFRPRVRARNVSGLGTAPVPAEPPKE